MDGNGHGTHVVGTIGAIGNNALGVAGVNWAVQMVALKFLPDSGSGSSAAAISAIDYYTNRYSSCRLTGCNIKPNRPSNIRRCR